MAFDDFTLTFVREKSLFVGSPICTHSREALYCIMKKGLLFSLIAMAIVLQACTPAEELRVEKVIAEYDYTSRCEVYDLVAQGNPTVVMDTAILFVTRSVVDQKGYIHVFDNDVYLTKDLTFSKSIENYSLSGKFEGSGMTASTDIVDLQAGTRTKCSYTGTKR